jgi:hypothetical protein
MDSGRVSAFLAPFLCLLTGEPRLSRFSAGASVQARV